MESSISLTGAMEGERLSRSALERAISALPIVRHLALRVRVLPDGGVECTLADVRPEHVGGLETTALNGGVILAMFDAVTVVSGIAHLCRHRCATVELDVSFVRAAPPHGARAVGRIVRSAGRLVFTRAELRDVRGNVCARAQGIVMRVGRRS